MPEIDVDRLIVIVTGIRVTAELGDRPLAYRLEKAVREFLAVVLPTPTGQPPKLAPVVVSDVLYLNDDELQTRPTLSVGGPGVNAVSAMLVDKIPSALAIDDTLLIQMDLELTDLRCAVWGMNHLDTVRAVETFVSKGYLETFLNGIIANEEFEPD